MSKTDLSPLTFEIISKLPNLVAQFEKYKHQNEVCGIRCDALEREIAMVKARIEEERSQQNDLQTQLEVYEGLSEASEQFVQRDQEDPMDITLFTNSLDAPEPSRRASRIFSFKFNNNTDTEGNRDSWLRKWIGNDVDTESEDL